MWSDALDTWWFHFIEVPTATVSDWAEIPDHADEADGTLWWVDTDVGEVLTMLRTNGSVRFVDLAGVAVPTEPRGDARLYHPQDANGLTMAELWRDRVEELGFRTEAQVLRPNWRVSWEGHLRLEVQQSLRLGSLRKGWRRIHRGADIVVRGVRARIDIGEALGQTRAHLDIDLTADNRTLPSSALSPALRSELVWDAVRCGAQPPDERDPTQ